LIVPTEQLRGVVNGVAVPKTPAQVGVPVDITVTGTNPCGAVRINPGDGTEAITHPITQVPTTQQHIYQKAGRFEVRAEGMGNCDGVVATSIDVRPAPAPAPPPTPPPAAAPSPIRVRDMDTDHDGVVTRAEWRGPDQAFRDRDVNHDGVLSGIEVQDTANEVVVAGGQRWTNTGVTLRAGDVIRIESAGTVQLSPNAADINGPAGAGERHVSTAPMPDRPVGGLIARIGNSAPIFVGADPTLRANASGQLYLGVNDDYLGDNRGEFRVRIEPPRGRPRR
jgi:hypothetical protein